MMLPLVGLITIVAVLAAILSKRVSPLVALIAFPILAALATGFGLETSHFILSGIQGIAGVIGMFVFAILFFGVLTDAKMLEPVVAWLLRMIGSRPSRCSFLRASLRSRRTASSFSLAFFSECFS